MALVILQHSGLAFGGGFVGVDVFFVISGFLITRLILRDCVAGTFSLRGFWLRRIRRILPAAAVTVVVTVLCGCLLLPPKQLMLLAESAIAQQFGVANIFFWLHGGYFDSPAELQPLLHMWSLAVEEQFYLFWPLLLLVLVRPSRRALLVAILVLLAMSLALSEVVTCAHPSTAFYWTPLRAWELLLGAGILFLPGGLTSRLQRGGMAGFLGCGLILFAAVTYTARTPFPGLSALVPCLGAALVIAAPSARKLSVSQLLSRGPISSIGRASYSIYLWHWPLLVYSKIVLADQFTGVDRVALVVASVAVGGLSYRWVEKPIRRRSVLADNRRLALSCALAAATIIIGCLAADCSVQRQEDESPVAGLTGQQIAPNGRPLSDVLGLDVLATDVLHVLGDVHDLSKGPAFVLWGDSHAKALAPLCDSLACRRGVYGVCLCRAGFAPLLAAWSSNRILLGKEPQLAWNRDVIAWIGSHHVHHVILAARWESKVPAFEVGPDYQGLLSDDIGGSATRAEARKVWEKAFRTTVLTLADGHTHLWFLRQVPVQRADAFGKLHGVPALGVTRRVYDEQQLEISRVIETYRSPYLTILGPGANWFDGADHSRKSDGTHSFYQDADHLSPEGAEKLIGPLLEPVFEVIARQ